MKSIGSTAANAVREPPWESDPPRLNSGMGRETHGSGLYWFNSMVKRFLTGFRSRSLKLWPPRKGIEQVMRIMRRQFV